MCICDHVNFFQLKYYVEGRYIKIYVHKNGEVYCGDCDLGMSCYAVKVNETKF